MLERRDILSRLRTLLFGGTNRGGALCVGGEERDETLATANTKGVTIWDVGSGIQIGTPLTTNGAAALSAAGAETDVNFDPRNDALSMLVQPTTDVGRSNGSAIDLRWDLDPDTWVTDACRIANRNLTRAEWTQYAGPAPYQEQCPGAR